MAFADEAGEVFVHYYLHIAFKHLQRKRERPFVGAGNIARHSEAQQFSFNLVRRRVVVLFAQAEYGNAVKLCRNFFECGGFAVSGKDTVTPLCGVLRLSPNLPGHSVYNPQN